MIPIALHIENQNVLVVGAGKVATRKIKQYLKEKANVYVVAPEYSLGLKVNYIQDDYKEEYLNDMFMVYAATNQKEVNEQIVKDCNKRNILCGNCNYDDDATFYSMNKAENELGIVALSTNQKLPYSKPLLDEMIQILEDKKERLTLIYEIRSAIVKSVENSKDYLAKLYDIDIEWLRFIHDSLLLEKGYIFIYHPGEIKENYKFDVHPSICISIDDIVRLQEYLVFNIDYRIVPLVISDGVIYNKLLKMITIPATISRPLVDNDEDLKQILQIYRSKDNTIYIIHPRRNPELKNMFLRNMEKNESIYDFGQNYSLKQNEVNRVVIFLLTHGGHYDDIVSQLSILKSVDYRIECNGNLLDNPEIIAWIAKKVK